MRRSSHATWIVAGFLFAIAAVLGTLSLAAIGLQTGIAGFVAGMLLAMVPVPFYIALALWIDRFEPEPPPLLAMAFLWGSSVAVFFALVFNTVHEGLLTAIAGPKSASELTTILSAPVVEEIAKGTALLLLFVWKRDEFDNVTDGIVYACMVGLGFAMTENIQYYGQAIAANGAGTAAGVFFLRGILGPFAHPLYTSMTGIGFGVARETDSAHVRRIAPFLGLGAAIALHALWNLAASLGLVFFAAYFFIMVPAAIGVLVIAFCSLRREARMIRAQLEPVLATGVLTRDDIEVVTSVRRRIGASTRALLRGGFGAWSARRRFHALATKLAFHAWHTSREAAFDAAETHAELVNALRAARVTS
jgi:RsiW-degrading membrane proteinase PrsW (M82 family)